MHFDVGEEFLACIFQTGPKEIYRIVDNQESIVISLADIDSDGWILLIMSRNVKLLLLRQLTGIDGGGYCSFPVFGSCQGLLDYYFWLARLH